MSNRKNNDSYKNDYSSNNRKRSRNSEPVANNGTANSSDERRQKDLK